VESGFVVDGDFLARPYVAQRDKQNVSVKDFHEGVWFARVIYVMRAVAATAAVETPVIINLTDAQFWSQRSTLCLGVCNSLTRVFRNFPRALEGDHRKASLTFNRRFSYCQTWRQLKLHLFGIVTQTDQV